LFAFYFDHWTIYPYLMLTAILTISIFSYLFVHFVYGQSEGKELTMTEISQLFLRRLFTILFPLYGY